MSSQPTKAQPTKAQPTKAQPTEADPRLAASAQQFLDDPTLPEPIRRALTAGMPLERLELDEEGHFYHQGEPFLNENVARLFHRSLRRTPGGTWLIDIPPFSYPLRVADTAYVVRRVEFRGEGEGRGEGEAAPLLTLSDETVEPLAEATLRYVEGRGLYCRVKGGSEPARFSRPAYFAIADRIESADDESDGRYWLRLGNRRLPIAGAE